MSRARLIAIALLGASCTLLSCTSARVAATVKGEPVCADFEIGAAHTMFKGALKKPVMITVLKSKTVVSKQLSLGKRKAAGAPSVLVVHDSNEKLTVRFAQCSNEFAPHPVEAVEPDAKRDAPKRRDDRASYDCGEEKVYKEITVTIRSGDPSSRVIPWQPPPDPECMTNVLPPAAGSTPAAASGSAARSP